MFWSTVKGTATADAGLRGNNTPWYTRGSGKSGVCKWLSAHTRAPQEQLYPRASRTGPQIEVTQTEESAGCSTSGGESGRVEGSRGSCSNLDGTARPAKKQRRRLAKPASKDVARERDEIAESAVTALVGGLSKADQSVLNERVKALRDAGKAEDVADALRPYIPTELIFKLERRGEGWAEEILPRLTVEKRPLTPDVELSRPTSSDRHDPWEEGSPERFLRDCCGIPAEEVDSIMTSATAWRVTPAGRPLIDRRRRSRAARNVQVVAACLLRLGVPQGREGVGSLFMRAPQLMLCKPASNDRWDRRAVELAAYFYRHGDSNVPEDDSTYHDLAVWVRRQRLLWQQGLLLQDRSRILLDLGVEVVADATITEEWEYKFDQLLEWLLLMGSSKASSEAGLEWLGLDWGRRGGMQGRECCIWVQLQRQLRQRNLLSTEAVRRLDSLGFCWEPQGVSGQEDRWAGQFGRLVFAVERSKKSRSMAAAHELARHPTGAQDSTRGHATQSLTMEGGDEEGLPTSRPAFGVLLGQQQQVAFKAEEGAWLQQEVLHRRQALRTAELDEGLAFWLAKQQWRWRKGRLAAEQVLLLRLLGVEFDSDDLGTWREAAHGAAAFLLGSNLHLDMPPKVPWEDVASQSHANGGWSANAPPGLRLRVQRWVLTQQALYSERRLSMAQIRYLALLELSWLLSRHQVMSEYLLWTDSLPPGLSPDAPNDRAVALRRVSALSALGWLAADQEARLRSAGLDLRPHRSTEDREWDARLTELLAFRRERGHCRVPRGGWAAAPGLARWLAEQRRAWRCNRLPAARLAQLAALGVDRRSEDLDVLDSTVEHA